MMVLYIVVRVKSAERLIRRNKMAVLLYKKIDEMDREELEGLQKELEQTIDELNEQVLEQTNVLNSVIGRIDKMDVEEEE
jgi:DNA anti-recombination protein RmuC